MRVRHLLAKASSGQTTRPIQPIRDSRTGRRLSYSSPVAVRLPDTKPAPGLPPARHRSRQDARICVCQSRGCTRTGEQGQAEPALVAVRVCDHPRGSSGGQCLAVALLGYVLSRVKQGGTSITDEQTGRTPTSAVVSCRREPGWIPARTSSGSQKVRPVHDSLRKSTVQSRYPNGQVASIPSSITMPTFSASRLAPPTPLSGCPHPANAS